MPLGSPLIRGVDLNEKPMGRETANPKYQLAYLLFMSGEHRATIAERVGVAPKTITEWSQKNHWKEKRSAHTITRPELVNKCLLMIGKILDGIISEESSEIDPAKTDQLIKLANTIERLDRKNNVVNDMETFMSFNAWLQKLSDEDKQLTGPILKLINQYQDKFITDRLSTR